MRNTIFWFKNSFRRTAMKQYKEALDNELLSVEELAALNWQKRKDIVTYAYSHTKFYRSFYDKEGFNPSMLNDESDWHKVPILEKDMVRDNREDLKNHNLPNKFSGVSTTGGSTGLPLMVYIDKRFKMEILGWRAFRWWNVSPSANIGIIHRNIPSTFISKLKNKLLWWPTSRVFLNASALSTKDLELFVNKIIQKKVVWLLGYVGVLEKVAEYILEHNIHITNLKLVWSTAAPLNKNVRTKMEKAFRCKVMNQYGSNEVGNIAIQCQQSEHLHINYDYVHVDVVDSNGTFQSECEGDILVTNLYGYTFPLIKYRLGDKGTLITDTCKCKSNLPMMKEVKGRVNDAIYTPDGTCVTGEYLCSMFDDYSTIVSQFQIRQKQDFSVIISIKVYKDDSETQNVLSQVKNELLDLIDNQITVDYLFVDHINDNAGKFRYIVCELDLDKLSR